MSKTNNAPLTDSWFADLFKEANNAVQAASEEQATQAIADGAKQIGAFRKALIEEGFNGSEAFQIVRMTLQQAHEQNMADA